MPQHYNVSPDGSSEYRNLLREWYTLREPMVAPDGPMPSQKDLDRVDWLDNRMRELEAPQPGTFAAALVILAGERESLAHAIQASADDSEDEAERLAGELAYMVAEWGALLRLPTMNDTQAARFGELNTQVSHASQRLARVRDRWCDRKRDALAHRLEAAYLRARAAAQDAQDA